MYVRSYVWTEQTVLRIDGEIAEYDRETIQAYEAIGDTARCYWPVDLIEPFVRQNWCARRSFFRAWRPQDEATPAERVPGAPTTTRS